MADFELVEADFQQYYNLDVSTLGFRRYARLLYNLPMEARFMRKYSPLKDWDWDKEIQSQILHAIDVFTTMYANANRKKGAKKLKPSEQPQPDYVKEAKKKIKEEQRLRVADKQAELAKFFEKRNKEMKKMEAANGT